MLKLTRLDHQTIAINPDHLAWVEATPDTTLCLLGDRKIIVRESVEEVIERFIAARAQVGCTSMGIAAMPAANGPSAVSAMGNHPSRRPSGRPGPIGFSSPPPTIIDDGPDSAPVSRGGYRGGY